MDFYGKWYRSNGGFAARYWYHLSIGMMPKDKTIGKRLGYWSFWYDGAFHFFGLWPFEIRWHKRPIAWYDFEERHK